MREKAEDQPGLIAAMRRTLTLARRRSCVDFEVLSLSSGLSSDVWLTIGPQDELTVLKKPLRQLRVQDEWFADIQRGKFEAEWLRFASDAAPGRVPRPLAYNETDSMVAMEFFPTSSYVGWREQLEAGEVSTAVATSLGHVLGALHVAGARPELDRAVFDARHILAGTRIDPYFTATAAKNPDLEGHISSLVHSTLTSDQTVIHGDISPKNILVRDEIVYIIDAECACIGDPAFDVSFFHSHLLLLCLREDPGNPAYIDVSEEFQKSYDRQVPWGRHAEFEAMACALLGLFILARVDGKVRLDFLKSEPSRELARDYGRSLLTGRIITLASAFGAWRGHILASASAMQPRRRRGEDTVVVERTFGGASL